ncbi:Hypothetical protein D9617_19g102110 [Elsinoe fawcettii]|nr:Hypothetical protein D9617_19g102110 [Elsinoe fawcettii]
MAATTTFVQVLSISTALATSGGIATLSLFDIPILKSQPASRSLPSIRWLFSRGSHVFPQAAFLAAGGFVYLAYSALPIGSRTVLQLLKGGGHLRPQAYLAAAALSISIGPITSFMLPVNFDLIKQNAKKGGFSSSANAARGKNDDQTSDGTPAQDPLGDLSGPQTETQQTSTREEDERVRELLTKFSQLNMLRALAVGAGGVVGLLAALM